jgi:hypothetical protein
VGGLWLVRSLVEMHGGQVEVSSAGAGKGSEFVLTFPALPPVPGGREKGEGEGPGGTHPPNTKGSLSVLET